MSSGQPPSIREALWTLVNCSHFTFTSALVVCVFLTQWNAVVNIYQAWAGSMDDCFCTVMGS